MIECSSGFSFFLFDITYIAWRRWITFWRGFGNKNVINAYRWCWANVAFANYTVLCLATTREFGHKFTDCHSQTAFWKQFFVHAIDEKDGIFTNLAQIKITGGFLVENVLLFLLLTNDKPVEMLLLSQIEFWSYQ